MIRGLRQSINKPLTETQRLSLIKNSLYQKSEESYINLRLKAIDCACEDITLKDLKCEHWMFICNSLEKFDRSSLKTKKPLSSQFYSHVKRRMKVISEYLDYFNQTK